MPRGRLPTAIVATTASRPGAITLMVLATSLLTYSRGSLDRVGAAPARNSGARQATVPHRAVRIVIGTSRSVVEDRLIDVERPVETTDAIASADAAQDRAQEVGSGQVGVRQVGAGEVGADEEHLAQVRVGEVRAAEVDPAGVDAH